MKTSISTVVTLLLVGFALSGSKEDGMELYPDIQRRIKTAIGEFNEIPEQRKERLREITAYVRSQSRQGKLVNLTTEIGACAA